MIAQIECGNKQTKRQVILQWDITTNVPEIIDKHWNDDCQKPGYNVKQIFIIFAVHGLLHQ